MGNRNRWFRRLIRRDLVLSLTIAPIAFLGAWEFSNNYAIGLNFSESLPQRVFLIRRGERDLHVGAYVAFEAPHNRFFPGRRFVKRVEGMAGSLVEHQHGHVFVDGRDLGPIQTKSTSNQPLYPGPVGAIPKDALFAAGIHERSYDSRYQSIGFVHLSDVVGRAYPLF